MTFGKSGVASSAENKNRFVIPEATKGNPESMVI
jgi:hypothetical protein